MIDRLRILALVLLLVSCSGETGSTPTTVVALATGVPTLPPTAAPTAAPATPAPSAPATVLPTPAPTASASPTPAAPFAFAFAYPIGLPGRAQGDGFFVRHGYATENTWYNPGYWHTGEDWYAQTGDTAGAQVYAISAGEVVYAGANYPGRVVIVRHADDLFSMYGHLDPNLAVRVGQQLALGDLIGTVLRRGDAVPNHLHFEVRTFLTTAAVNGAQPRYDFRCGPNCPPGPGYWPISAPDHPSALGWRNPTHVIAGRMAAGAGGTVLVASAPISPSVTLWSAPPSDKAAQALGDLALQPGARFALLSVWSGPEDSQSTSALGYQLWYQLQLPDARSGWVQAAVPSAFDTGSDQRPSSVSFNFYPALAAR